MAGRIYTSRLAANDTAGDDAAKALLEREKEKWTDYLKGGFKYVTSATESDGLSGPEGTSVTGSMSLLWANVSTFISRGESCDRADVTTVTGKGGGTKATIAYVKTEAEFAACLNLFVMLAIAVSIPAIPLCEFIYLVVHDSVLRRDRTWQAAVVLLVVTSSTCARSRSRADGLHWPRQQKRFTPPPCTRRPSE